MKSISAFPINVFKNPVLLYLILALGMTAATGCGQMQNAPIETAPAVPTWTPEPANPVMEDTPETEPTIALPAETPVPASQVCSPIDGFSIAEVNSIKTNPLKPPSPGKDDGHHGIDFSFWTFRELDTIEGMGITSVLDGVVAGTVNNRFPYGYMVMVETPVDQLPVGLQEYFSSLQPSPLIDLSTSPLSCPAIGSADFAGTGRSLYLVYAHMLDAATLNPGDAVTCGSPLGQIGNSGDSSNAHLHFEARLGPSGFRFNEMAHYLTDSSDLERYNYCAWRVSGIFQLVDPQVILDAGSQ